MRVLFFGAGPLGSLYAHLLHQAGTDVSILARGPRYDWLRDNGVVLRNEMTGQEGRSRINLISALNPDDSYDLVVVLIRKNRLDPVFEALACCPGLRNILFMGNNALGFDAYQDVLDGEKLLFGFPGAGGGINEQVVHYADRETSRGKRRAITIGEPDGAQSERLLRIKNLFESAGVPVDTPDNIDGWLRYHVALVIPLVGALYMHQCNNYELAEDRDTVRSLVRAALEGARVLESLGYKSGQPSEFVLMKWLPGFMSVMALRKMLGSRFAEVAFAMHATSARDEMQTLADEFRLLSARASVATPDFDALTAHISSPGGLHAGN